MTKLQQAYQRVHKNFMTPEVLQIEYTKDNRVIELSKGFGIDQKDLYGVTEFILEDNRLETTRRGTCYGSRQKANKHFKNLVENTYHE